MTLKDKIVSELVHTDAEIMELRNSNIKKTEIRDERFKKLKSDFLKELRKTAYPRLKRVYGGIVYAKYLTSSPEFNQAFRNLITNIESDIETELSKSLMIMAGVESEAGRQSQETEDSKQLMRMAEIESVPTTINNFAGVSAFVLMEFETKVKKSALAEIEASKKREYNKGYHDACVKFTDEKQKQVRKLKEEVSKHFGKFDDYFKIDEIFPEQKVNFER